MILRRPTQDYQTAARKIPTLVMFGDHLGDVQGWPVSWADVLSGLSDIR